MNSTHKFTQPRLRTGTLLEWQRFLKQFSPEKLKRLDGSAKLDQLVREEDFIAAQEVASALIEGNDESEMDRFMRKAGL